MLSIMLYIRLPLPGENKNSTSPSKLSMKHKKQANFFAQTVISTQQGKITLVTAGKTQFSHTRQIPWLLWLFVWHLAFTPTLPHPTYPRLHIFPKKVSTQQNLQHEPGFRCTCFLWVALCQAELQAADTASIRHHPLLPSPPPMAPCAQCCHRNSVGLFSPAVFPLANDSPAQLCNSIVINFRV